MLAAQADGSLNRALPPIAVLYTLYARACDPVLGFLKGSGQYSSEQIIDMVLSTCFHSPSGCPTTRSRAASSIRIQGPR